METRPTDCAKPSPSSKPVRLNRFLASCGIDSRRNCDVLIQNGRIAVDGELVTEPGMKVIPGVNRVTYNGYPVQPEAHAYFLLNKPRDVITTVFDPEGRETVLDLIPDLPARVYPVGRLDRYSEGLLIITNDGDLANRLTHPRYHFEKEYYLWTRPSLTPWECRRFTSGIQDDGETLRALVCEPGGSGGGPNGEYTRVVLGEGRNRQIRRMVEALDLRVVQLKRVRIGPIQDRTLRLGESRPLTAEELRVLKEL